MKDDRADANPNHADTAFGIVGSIRAIAVEIRVMVLKPPGNSPA